MPANYAIHVPLTLFITLLIAALCSSGAAALGEAAAPKRLDENRRLRPAVPAPEESPGDVSGYSQHLRAH